MLALYLALNIALWVALFFSEESKEVGLVRIILGCMAVWGAFLFLREMGYVVKL